MSERPGTAPATAAELSQVLTHGRIRSLYQPVVDLDSGATVAFEALARGPRGTALEAPDVLFAAARAHGLLDELDRACQLAAFAGVRAAGLVAPWTVFVNVEPAAAHAALGPAETGSPDVGVVVELTERDLVSSPPDLLRLVSRIRGRGWGIALDDVGADSASLALLPLLRPDVIKLDLRLVQARPSADIAHIVAAVNAEAERSGTLILAEGIESTDHLDIARSLGARLGQGWLLGRPQDLPFRPPPPDTSPISIVPRPAEDASVSPFALAAGAGPPRRARKQLLVEISKHLERQALSAGESAVVLSTFQDATFFTPRTRRRYAELSVAAAFVGALGRGMSPSPLPGVRGSALDPSDPLLGEWDIAVVGPHYAAALVARDLGDTGPDRDRRFEFVLSHNRELAIGVALALFARVWPAP